MGLAMAKRDSATKRAGGQTAAAGHPAATTGDPMESRVVAYAIEIGRVAGTVLGKAEGWMDRKALARRLASVRDGAADLIAQLAASPSWSPAHDGVAARTSKAKAARSGGAVDAPGKKHRKPTPAGPAAGIARNQAAKMREARPMEKTVRRRGRG
jgi:hypothetical protein